MKVLGTSGASVLRREAAEPFSLPVIEYMEAKDASASARRQSPLAAPRS